jgi:HTH-type transcriptional regulator/antitoxin HigA
MEIKPIRDDRGHDQALKEIERIWGSKPGTPEGDRLDVLIALADAYERTRFQIDLPDPIAAIRFRLEQRKADYGELVGIIGPRTRVYEVMKGDRALSLAMIRRLHARLGIPAEILIQPVTVRRRKAKRVA